MTSHENDRFLYFRLDKPVENDDLEIILLYLENEKQSNGGDIQSWTMNNHELKIEYEDVSVKQRVLARPMYHKCLTYTLIAYAKTDMNHLPIEQNAHQVDNKILLHNISTNEVDEAVELYVSYLQPDNDIVEIVQPRSLGNTYLITYKNSVDFGLLAKRLAKRPILRGNTIKSYRVYDFDWICLKKSALDFKLLDFLLVAGGENSTSTELNLYENEDFYLVHGSLATAPLKGEVEKCWSIDLVVDLGHIYSVVSKDKVPLEQQVCQISCVDEFQMRGDEEANGSKSHVVDQSSSGVQASIEEVKSIVVEKPKPNVQKDTVSKVLGQNQKNKSNGKPTGPGETVKSESKSVPTEEVKPVVVEKPKPNVQKDTVSKVLGKIQKNKLNAKPNVAGKMDKSESKNMPRPGAQKKANATNKPNNKTNKNPTGPTQAFPAAPRAEKVETNNLSYWFIGNSSKPSENPPPFKIDLKNPLSIALVNCTQIYNDCHNDLIKANMTCTRTDTQICFKPQACDHLSKWQQKLMRLLKYYESLVFYAKLDLNNFYMLNNFDEILGKLKTKIAKINLEKKQFMFVFIDDFNMLTFVGYEQFVKHAYQIVVDQVKAFYFEHMENLNLKEFVLRIPPVYVSELVKSEELRKHLAGCLVEHNAKLNDQQDKVIVLESDPSVKPNDWYIKVSNFMSSYLSKCMKIDKTKKIDSDQLAKVAEEDSHYVSSRAMDKQDDRKQAPLDVFEDVLSKPDTKQNDFVVELSDPMGQLLKKCPVLYNAFNKYLNSCNAKLKPILKENKLLTMEVCRINEGSSSLKNWKKLAKDQVDKFLYKNTKIELFAFKPNEKNAYVEFFKSNQAIFETVYYELNENSVKIWGHNDQINKINILYNNSFDKPQANDPMSLLTSLILDGSGTDAFKLNPGNLYTRALASTLALKKDFNSYLDTFDCSLVVNMDILTILDLKNSYTADDMLRKIKAYIDDALSYRTGKLTKTKTLPTKDDRVYVEVIETNSKKIYHVIELKK